MSKIQVRITLPVALHRMVNFVREKWNPERAIGNPAHITIAYHDKAPDAALLEKRLRKAVGNSDLSGWLSENVRWNGTDIIKSPAPLRSVLGYLPQDFGVYPHLNGLEFLEYMAAIKGLSAGTARRRIDELLTAVNLVNVARRPLGG